MPASPPPDRKNRAFEHPLKRPVKRRGNYTREQVIVGLLGTLLAHIWIFYMLSLGFLQTEAPKVEDKYREFSIELEAPEEPEEPEEQQIYTQTNPDVPENEPDETNRFAARDQQAANEEKPEEIDPDNRPAVESDDTIETDQVLTGSLEEPLLAPPPSPDPSESAEENQTQPAQPPSLDQPLLIATDASSQAQRKEVPLFGSLEDQEDESGIADYDYSKLEEPATNVTDLVEGEDSDGEEEKTLDENPASPASVVRMPVEAMNAGQDGFPSPRARPQLPRLPSGPTRDSRLGVSSMGKLAVDAKASKFGEYMERLIETVKFNWDDLVQRSSTEEGKSVVKIKFMLNSAGVVTDIEILEGTTSRAIGIYMCRQAIERGVPYGEWPEGLVEMFGEEEDITFNFYYY